MSNNLKLLIQNQVLRLKILIQDKDEDGRINFKYHAYFSARALVTGGGGQPTKGQFPPAPPASKSMFGPNNF